ncbi:condensation domain-containing protein, partial [Streptomyces sp. NPDC001985]|uniref:condensation domain-containing protein n=1 Tax=Streptomyces sp. NPDC001985 TaxID=3154406 RepID=UPI003316A04F
LDILPLSPLQEGLLFHALYDVSGPDVYVVQLVFELEGRVDSGRLREAGEALLRRYPNVSARFVVRGEGGPVQVIPAEVELPWREVDLRGGPAGGFEGLVEEERGRRFDVSCPPLLRWVLVRLGEERYSLVLTVHHILLDGWSVPLLVRDLFGLYGGVGLGRPVVYREYLAWLAGRDREAARAAWGGALAGLEGPCRLVPGAVGGVGVVPEQVVCGLPEGLTGRLEEWARGCGLTVNTLVQGAWALVLGVLTGRADTVFGTTVSGRPPEIPGVESMVGLFINTVPVRVRLDPAETLGAFFRRVQREQSELLDHQYLSLADIQQTTGTGTGELFDTTTVFE